MKLNVTLADAVRAGTDISLTVELRLTTDLPGDPPRRTFTMSVRADETLPQARVRLLERVHGEVVAYQEEQARAAEIAAKAAALVGQTWTVEV